MQEEIPAADLTSRIQSLEKRMDYFQEWLREDNEWKQQLDERLKVAGI